VQLLKHPSESWSPGVTAATGSVERGVIFDGQTWFERFQLENFMMDLSLRWYFFAVG